MIPVQVRLIWIILGVNWVSLLPLLGQAVHPRGLIQAEEVTGLREKVHKGPAVEWLQQLRRDIQENEHTFPLEPDLYRQAYRATDIAALYLFTGNSEWAQIAFDEVQELIRDTLFTDPFSRGLTRAMLLQNVTLVYDFCYNSWGQTQREQVNEAIFSCMMSLSSNMGFSANYNLASNWMGVRYGAVLLAALVWDDPLQQTGKRSRALPIQWDVTKRLLDHLEKNTYTNGWNGESLGYHNYNWSFVGPALIALQNRIAYQDPSFLHRFAPKVVNSLHALCINAISIPTRHSIGMKPDLSDDNPNGNISKLLHIGMRLYPASQTGALNWMSDYLDHPANYRSALVFKLLYLDETPQRENPHQRGWLTYHDPDQGIVVFRNRYEDDQDVVSLMSATAQRVKGHQGPDTHTFRLLGLGVPWIIGGGRTSLTAGQTNLFPSSQDTPEKGDRSLGKLWDYKFEENGSGYAWSSGSCLGVKNHRRYFRVDYDSLNLAEAVVMVSDSSTNGRRWRINTPEFNAVEVQDDGYILRAPNGSSLRVYAVSVASHAEVNVEKVRYGGKTIRLNAGIGYRGNTYTHSKAINMGCDGNIFVVMTLVRPGKQHPKVKWNAEERRLWVGKRSYNIP